VIPGLVRLGGRELGLHGILDSIAVIAGIDDPRGQALRLLSDQQSERSRQ
jgi:hypothetical protein